ncbi:hypothetical protein F4811DRAFT_517729 [Daldinia bambusicola]|nr:hypothetical protein F4811DRAFT_517729 [Daldinia bambusicola]
MQCGSFLLLFLLVTQVHNITTTPRTPYIRNNILHICLEQENTTNAIRSNSMVDKHMYLGLLTPIFSCIGLLLLSSSRLEGGSSYIQLQTTG